MAGIDKIYIKSFEELIEFYNFIQRYNEQFKKDFPNCQDGLMSYTYVSFDDNWEESYKKSFENNKDLECPITNFPDIVNRWLILHRDIIPQFMLERLKEQYASSYDDFIKNDNFYKIDNEPRGKNKIKVLCSTGILSNYLKRKIYEIKNHKEESLYTFEPICYKTYIIESLINKDYMKFVKEEYKMIEETGKNFYYRLSENILLKLYPEKKDIINSTLYENFKEDEYPNCQTNIWEYCEELDEWYMYDFIQPRHLIDNYDMNKTEFPPRNKNLKEIFKSIKSYNFPKDTIIDICPLFSDNYHSHIYVQIV